MEDYLFVPNQKIADHLSKQKETAKYYTAIGNQEFLDDDGYPRVDSGSKKIFAKSVAYNGREKFYIKVGVYGKIFNPIGMYSEGKENKFLSKIGKDEFQLKQVGPVVFEFYLNFLRTKNIAWLNNAQREYQ